MAGVLTTLALDACCACYKTMRAAQHTLNNLRSLGVGFLAISNNQSRFKPFKCCAHPVLSNYSLKSYQSVSAWMVVLFFFSNASSWVAAWLNDNLIAWLTSVSASLPGCGAAPSALTWNK
jgi:hypothetical protein